MVAPQHNEDMATALPALFISHGSPMFALEPGKTGPALHAWAQALPEKPRAIVVLSPHWMTRGVEVMTHPRPETWHDFGGFPAALYELQYPAPGSPELADRVLALLGAAGIAAQPNAAQPFDHGVWVPLMHLFPEADIPVVQVSLPVRYTPASVMAMGQALRPLREEGVLVIGSGSMTHNLRECFGEQPAIDAPAELYVREFCDWVMSRIHAGARDALLDYRMQAPHAQRAHPTDEHFVPLYFALGASAWGGQTDSSDRSTGAVTTISDEVMHRYLAMHSLSFQ
jgi:4,5-DOPA dioxygenase extradiol